MAPLKAYCTWATPFGSTRMTMGGLASRRSTALIQEAVAATAFSCSVLSRATGTCRSGFALVRSQVASNPAITFSRGTTCSSRMGLPRYTR